jgi:hypothetical protein
MAFNGRTGYQVEDRRIVASVWLAFLDGNKEQEPQPQRTETGFDLFVMLKV